MTLTVANYNVARIFVDTGSSINILFKKTIDQIKVKGFGFDPISTALFGFPGHVVQPLGQIMLPLSLGCEPRRVTKMTCFTVMDSPSFYNGILGRPALAEFRAVGSTYHQKMKFLVGKEIGVVSGDQKSARRSYVYEVKDDVKSKEESGNGWTQSTENVSFERSSVCSRRRAKDRGDRVSTTSNQDSS